MRLKDIVTKFKRRPFPTQLAALKALRISYSQFGEDIFLSNLLGYEKTDGVYVDIGCFHPIRYSNTYVFYQRGWKGLVVDPNIDWKNDWLKYRPRDKFVCAAISNDVSKYSYIKDRIHPACNRLTTEENPTLSENETSVSVDSRRINEVLTEHLKSRTIDLLNIDCEGYDIRILADLDFDNWSPHIIAAEDSTVDTHSELATLLASKGYECKAHIGMTKIFKRKD